MAIDIFVVGDVVAIVRPRAVDRRPAVEVGERRASRGAGIEIIVIFVSAQEVAPGDASIRVRVVVRSVLAVALIFPQRFLIEQLDADQAVEAARVPTAGDGEACRTRLRHAGYRRNADRYGSHRACALDWKLTTPEIASEP